MSAEPGAKRLTFRGYSAWYSIEEQREMLTLPKTPEGEKVAALIHEAKAHADATLLPSAP